jgi:cell division transport system permease protein
MPREKTSKRPKLAREGIGGRFLYFIERACVNIRQNILINILTIVTIALAFLILSLFLLIYVNLERVTESWSDRVQVTVYFDREIPSNEVAAMSSKIRAMSGTAGVQYISRAEAFKRFQQRLRGQEALLDGVSADVLPSSLEIRLKRESRDSGSLMMYVSQLRKIPGMGEIQYGEEWVRRFTDFMNLVRFAGSLVGGFIILAVVFIVANTIKLTIYSRKDELELLGLVGATRMFIKAPFLIEGTLQGGAGAGVALLILSGAYMAFLHKADILFSFNPVNATLFFLPWTYLAALMLGGALLGFLGSLASLKRFISL